MLRLVDLLGLDYEYSYMLSRQDPISEGKIRVLGTVHRVPPLLYKHARWRRFLLALGPSLRQLVVLMYARPHAILSTGSNLAVPVSLFGRLAGVKIIHVETGSRVHTMSATGRFMYRIAHRFFVQWEPLQHRYPRAIYAGRLL
jgi:UDP-N-acetylglucosamine:LPS N-acetylglucosamine transferase